jgi:hypothetical protein
MELNTLTNTISPYFTDEDLITQLNLQLPYEEQHTVDFTQLFHEIEDNGDTLQLRFRGTLYNIDKITGTVTEAKQ